MIKLKHLQIIVLIVCICLILVGCKENNEAVDANSLPQEAFSKLNADEQLKIERATPVMLMNLYFIGINEERPLVTVATLHPDYLRDIETLDNATALFSGYKVKNISIEENTIKNKETDTSKTYHLIISFEVVELKGDAKWTAGEGSHTYFIEFAHTKDAKWAIKKMSTSP